MFSKLFGSKKSAKTTTLTATINAPLQPVHRGGLFEDPLDQVLQQENLGEVSGGGTMQEASGEISYCDIEISVSGPLEPAMERIILVLEAMGAPKGSKLLNEVTGETRPLGQNEGLAFYLDGANLPPQVYQDNDVNQLIGTLCQALGDQGHLFSHWEGPEETALYFFGTNFTQMQDALAPIVATHPLCQNARVVQIA